LLEQYLIIKLRPTLNKKLIATPGIMWSPSAIQKHREKLAFPVYIYIKEEDGKLTLIQIFPSGRSVGKNLGMSQGFYKSVKIRSKGWYKDKLYLLKLILIIQNKTYYLYLSFQKL
jgi:hypothetical protein